MNTLEALPSNHLSQSDEGVGWSAHLIADRRIVRRSARLRTGGAMDSSSELTAFVTWLDADPGCVSRRLSAFEVAWTSRSRS
jgi:hypothetical protein